MYRTKPVTSNILDKASLPEQFSTDNKENILIPIKHLTCYEISGEDAQTFLQGQFSNDVSDVNANIAQLSSYCTPKGRMLAIFYLCQWQDKYCIILSRDCAGSVIARLKMFVLRSKVEIKSCENTLLLGLHSSDSENTLDQLNLKTPEDTYQCTFNETSLCINIPGSSPRYLILGEESLNQDINRLDADNLKIYSDNYWQWLDIMAGIPNVSQATQEAFVPQMANMELINGVSFSKGCYPGQEVVARLHYLGNANRRMFRIETNSEGTVKAGDNIYKQDSDQAIGKVMTVVALENNNYSALAVLRIEAAKQDALYIGSTSGSTAQIMPLPYDVPTEAKQET